jgi:hypothetical protein
MNWNLSEPQRMKIFRTAVFAQFSRMLVRPKKSISMASLSRQGKKIVTQTTFCREVENLIPIICGTSALKVDGSQTI